MYRCFIISLLWLLLAVTPVDSAEPAVSVALGGADRQAIFFRAEMGLGLAGFLPTGATDWRLRLYPSLGEIACFAAADFDGDGLADLLVIGPDGSYATWPGDGAGGFALKSLSRGTLPGFYPVAARPLRRPGAAIPDLLLIDAAGRRLQMSNDRFGNFPAASATAGTGDALSPDAGFAADFTGSGRPDRVEPLGDRLRIHPASGGAPVDLASPWLIRSVVTGNFNGDDRPDLALVSFGERPALRLFFNRGMPGTSAESPPPFLPYSPDIASATVSVTACFNAFCPANVDINLNDTIAWSNLGFTHDVWETNGGCTKKFGGFSSHSIPVPGGTYSFQFQSSGTFTYMCSPHCVDNMIGVVRVAVPVTPGTVPETGSTPFTISRASDGTLNLFWDVSCSPTVSAYEVYEGVLGSWYSHVPVAGLCSVNFTSANVTSAPGSRYYLVVPRTTNFEGSYGRDSDGAQIPPPATGACLPQNLAGSC